MHQECSIVSLVDAGGLHKLARTIRQLATEASSDQLDRPSGAELLVGTDVFLHSPTSVGEIAARTGVTQSQVSSIVAQLRAAEIVTSDPDPRDRRRTLLTVTAQARREQGVRRGRRDVRTVIRTHLEHIGADTGDSDVDSLLGLLDAVADRLAVADRPSRSDAAE